MTPRVVVVGLGPAGPDLVTTGTLAAIERIPRRFLRTTRHPSAGVVPDAVSFDAVYERADSMDQVYQDIVDELTAAAATHGEILYAVPGSPVVAEHTVELLLVEHDVEVEIVPALSFLDLAWARLGVDPVAVGARVVDGHRFTVEAAGSRGPLLVAQCDRTSVLSDIKLAVDVEPELDVTVIARLGAPDESITQVAWADLDRSVDPDHLTSLWIPELAAPVAGEVQRFDELVARLRDECPWDQEQTHRSLARHLLEETYEVLEVLDRFPDDEADDADGQLYDDLEEELGDLLFQICFHTRLATEAGAFTLAHVARRVHDKLVSRHPHVFGEIEVDDARGVETNWERIKADEKGRTSAFDGIPTALPGLVYAAKVLERADRGGIDPLGAGVVRDVGVAPGEDALGDTLLDLVASARRAGLDPERALRISTERALAAMRDTEEHGPA
ncbi:MAG: MazG nucleotide pyrophosphohydrolase domain-containing protein [Acidimicrobiales bacterium]